MSFTALGILSTLAAFGVASLAASALVLVVWRLVQGRLEDMPPAPRARLLLGLRLFPTAAGLAASLGLFLPSYVFLEPRHMDEVPGVTLWVFAALGLAAAARGLWRLLSTVIETDRLVRLWSRGAKPVTIEGVDCPVYRVESSSPIVALAGARHPKLYIAGSVLDDCRPELVSAMAAHEVGHWHSGDNVKRLFLEGAADPLRLFSSGRRILEEWESASEESADDEAIALGARPEDLAESLVRVARLAVRVPLSGVAGAAAFYRGEAFERRVRRLIAFPARLVGPVSGAGRRAALVGLLVAAAWLATSPNVLEPVHRALEIIVSAP